MSRSLDLALGATLAALAAWLFAPVLNLAFTNTDDWFHLDVAAGLLSLDSGAYALALRGDAPSDALRLTPYLLWAGDWLLFGLNPRGYFATNLALHLGAAAALYVAVRHRADAWAAAVAAAVFAFEPVRAEPTYFLSAREDGLSVLLVAISLAAWPRLRSSRRGLALAALLYAAAVFSKAPALVLPGLLWALDRADGVQTRRWRALLGVAALWVAAALVVGALAGAGAHGAAPLELIARRAAALFAPWPAFVLLAILPLGKDRTLATLGATWLGLGLLIAAPWILRVDGGLHGRYLLLASLGAGTLAAGLLPLRPTARVAAALALVGACVVRFQAAPPGAYVVADRTTADFLHQLDAAPDHVPVLLAQPHDGVSGLLASPALAELRPSNARTVTALQGASHWRTPGPDRFAYATWQPGDAIAPGTQVLTESGLWTIPQPPTLPPGFDPEPIPLRFTPPPQVRRYPLHMPIRPGIGDRESTSETLGPSVFQACTLRLTATLDGEERGDGSLLDAPVAAVLRWGSRPAQRIVAPLHATTEVALWTSRAWVETPRAPTQLSLTLLGDGDVTLHSAELLPCAGD